MVIGDRGFISSAGAVLGPSYGRAHIQVLPSLYAPASEITVPAPPPPSGSSGDGWVIYENNTATDNAPLIAATLMAGSNVKLRLSTAGNSTFTCGGILDVEGATGPWLDLNGNLLKWTRVANTSWTPANPGPNGEVEWDPTGGEGSNPASQREHVAFTNCTNVLLKGGTIQGFDATAGQFNSTLEKEAAIMLRNVSTATVENMFVRNVWGDGIALRAVSAYLPRINENITINTLTVETVGRMQAALTNFMHLTINGFFTSPSSTYTHQGTLFPNSGRTPRSALDIEMVSAAASATGGGPNAALAESAYATITNFFISANFFALANGGGGYVHDIEMHSGTLSNMGQNMLTILGRNDDSFARRANFHIHHIVWPEVGGANNAMGADYVRQTFKVHDIDVNESNLSAGKNGINMKECEGVEIYSNNFTGGFVTVYTDDLEVIGNTSSEYPPAATNSGTSSWTDGDWGTAVETAFTNPGSVDDDDNDRASAVLTGTLKSFDLQATSFPGMALEASSTIRGFQVSVAGFAEASNSLRVALTANGTLKGTYQAGSLTVGAADVTLTFGGTTDTWGTAWTQTEATATSFGIWLGILGGGTVQLDSVRLKTFNIYPIGPSTIVRYENNVPAAP